LRSKTGFLADKRLTGSYSGPEKSRFGKSRWALLSPISGYFVFGIAETRPKTYEFRLPTISNRNCLISGPLLDQRMVYGQPPDSGRERQTSSILNICRHTARGSPGRDPRPVGLSLDRKNFNGHYEPTNCISANRTVQANNTRIVWKRNGWKLPPKELSGTWSGELKRNTPRARNVSLRTWQRQDWSFSCPKLKATGEQC